MKVQVLEPRGYCAGVTRAIQIALQAKNDNPDKKVYVFGMLVHNHQTIDFLKENGIQTLEYDQNILPTLEEGSILVFTAHGHDEAIEKEARSLGLIIYDATCPVVLNNIKVIKEKLQNGYQIIFIGKRNHPETNAILSISKNIYLYDDELLNNNQLSTKYPIFVANQTTLNYKELLVIHSKIKEVFPLAEIINEVCSTTRLRQESLRNIPSEADLVVIVGSTCSNNTMKLFDIAKTLYEDKVIIAESEDGLDLEIIQNKKFAIVSSGASTPNETIEAIVKKLESI